MVDEASVLNDVLEDVAEQRVLKAGLLEKSTGSGWLVSALLEEDPKRYIVTSAAGFDFDFP